jgi:hypothetical protein
MPSSDFSGLRHKESEAVVTISKQVFVAKEKSWAKGCSNKAKLGKDWLDRGVKRRAGCRLEIDPQNASGVLFAPFPNGISLPCHCPLRSSVRLPKIICNSGSANTFLAQL